MNSKQRASRNRTLTLTDEQRKELATMICRTFSDGSFLDQICNAAAPEIFDSLPDGCADLLFLDPPYNMTKDFNGFRFHTMTDQAYMAWLETWFPPLLRLLKPTASIYFCGDWRNSSAIFQILAKYGCIIRNRIVWQREKGRGAANNWKNSCEDIWFATVGKKYTFHVDAVKVKKRVIAPYRTKDGTPKDWQCDKKNGSKFRLTCPGNFWDDLTVPYWSMPENTDHPTQKPEKLLAKLILASTNEGDVVLDPFLGSGTTVVTAKKLNRHFIGIEQDPEYCLWAAARLKRAETDASIQGYSDGVFRERNLME